MTDKFTPGPWIRDGVRVEMQSGEMLFWSDVGYGGHGHPDANGEAEANARLIAASPELYEALSEAVKTNPQPEWIELLAKAREMHDLP